MMRRDSKATRILVGLNGLNAVVLDALSRRIKGIFDVSVGFGDD